MPFKENLGRVAMRMVAGMVALGSLATLASCGGGTYQVTAFAPARIISFGDESSHLQGPQGLKYSINGVVETSRTIDCTIAPIWNEVVATSYGLIYSNCNPNASSSTNALDLTTINGTVDDVVNSVAAFQAGDTFNYNDLVTIWVGTHDILNEYQANGAGDQATLLANMRAQGATLAGVVNAIAAAGGKVLLLTVPSLSDSPFGYAESQRGDFDRFKLLQDMTTQFNLGLRSNIVNDGSKIGLVLVDDLVHNAARNPGGFSMIQNASQIAGCLDTAPLPTCTPDTLKTDPATGQATVGYMWADDTHLGSIMQQQIGNQASSRAHTNPF